ncbi:MAG: protein rep [bacterium]|nr:protein rep [bacterium]
MRRERAAEIAAAVEAHGAERIFMLTLTVRHGETISLKTAREGLSACWSKFVSGSQWARFRSRLGIVGYLRVLEVTHAKGWHPHLHVYLFVENPDQMDLEQYNFQARWRRLVGKNMGNAYEPTLSQGLTVTSVSDAADAGRYVEKLGLRHEKTRGEDESGARYPLEILDDLVEYKNRRDYRLWMEYQEGIFGARQLTWSVGLRDNLGLGKEKCDEELAPESGLEAGVAQEQVCETEGERKARRESERAANRERYERRKAAIERDRRERLICTIPVEIWREIVRYPLAEVTIRSIAQTDGWAGVWRYIRKVQSIQGTREVDSG